MPRWRRKNTPSGSTLTCWRHSPPGPGPCCLVFQTHRSRGRYFVRCWTCMATTVPGSRSSCSWWSSYSRLCVSVSNHVWVLAACIHTCMCRAVFILVYTWLSIHWDCRACVLLTFRLRISSRSEYIVEIYRLYKPDTLGCSDYIGHGTWPIMSSITCCVGSNGDTICMGIHVYALKCYTVRGR